MSVTKNNRWAMLGLLVAVGLAVSDAALAQAAGTGTTGSSAPGTGGTPLPPANNAPAGTVLRNSNDTNTIAPSGGASTSDPAVTVSPGSEGGPTNAGTTQTMPVTPHRGQAIAPGGDQTGTKP